MNFTRREILSASTSAVLLVGCGGGGGLGGGSSFVPPPAEVPEIEAAMFARVNQDRAAKDLPALAYDESLAGVARAHALDMRTNKYFAHDSPTTGSLDDRLAHADLPVATARENLAESYEMNAAEDGLLKSPGHYANLMANDITHVGIGIVRGGAVDPRNLLFVQVFARPVPKETTEEARSNVIRAIEGGRATARRPAFTVDDALEEAAAELLPSMNDDVDERSVRAVSVALIERLKGDGVVAPITVIGRRIVTSLDFVPESILVESPTLALGLAAEVRRDEAGKRFLKLLIFARTA